MTRRLTGVLAATTSTALAVALMMNCGGSDGGGTGGTPGTGGATGGSTGGASTGGTGTGGATGGSTGGSATGGSATGGATGGSATTGGSAGGKAGGSATGGSSVGGGKAGGSGSGTGGTVSACADGTNNIKPAGGMTLISPDHAECAKFDVKWTCACGTMNTGITCTGSVGANGNNPELEWGAVPDGTKSFALTFLDTTQLDMNKPQMGNHWAMWNIPAAARKLPRNSNGTYTGDLAGAKATGKFFEPCPSATDKYEFALYALSTETLNVTGANPNVMAIRDALKTATPLGVATLHGSTGVGGK